MEENKKQNKTSAPCGHAPRRRTKWRGNDVVAFVSICSLRPRQNQVGRRETKKKKKEMKNWYLDRRTSGVFK